MKINEMFSSLQGEGMYNGFPVIFLRLSKCTRACSYCDTKYHKNGVETNINELIRKIKKFRRKTIVWTGGEPTLQIGEIYTVIKLLGKDYIHHIETNGDMIVNYDYFDYVCFSPKDEKTAKYIYERVYDNLNFDIKVVTDLKINKKLIKYATMLMPLTTNNKKKDFETKQKVWNYCNKNNYKYSPRLHVDVWGTKKRKI